MGVLFQGSKRNDCDMFMRRLDSWPVRVVHNDQASCRQ